MAVRREFWAAALAALLLLLAACTTAPPKLSEAPASEEFAAARFATELQRQSVCASSGLTFAGAAVLGFGSAGHLASVVTASRRDLELAQAAAENCRMKVRDMVPPSVSHPAAREAIAAEQLAAEELLDQSEAVIVAVRNAVNRLVAGERVTLGEFATIVRAGWIGVNEVEIRRLERLEALLDDEDLRKRAIQTDILLKRAHGMMFQAYTVSEFKQAGPEQLGAGLQGMARIRDAIAFERAGLMARGLRYINSLPRDRRVPEWRLYDIREGMLRLKEEMAEKLEAYFRSGDPDLVQAVSTLSGRMIDQSIEYHEAWLARSYSPGMSGRAR